ncbi:uncharacterized protein TrAtP1_001465 [Trichoderma atroviride]|uniref:uncharacterized protein n=1 Tax=Hypocrea atroviridis TaxID=63577 RepID=UPI0033230524|nr:hypothetical protein TrAtP1_001465 [Trichoderma atroviride]
MASLPQKGKDDIASTISKLSISSAKQAAPSKKSKEPVADSWEDEDVSDDEAAEAEQVEEQGQSKDADADAAGTSTPSSLATPAVPPPTPASPLGYESPPRMGLFSQPEPEPEPEPNGDDGIGIRYRQRQRHPGTEAREDGRRGQAADCGRPGHQGAPADGRAEGLSAVCEGAGEEEEGGGQGGGGEEEGGGGQGEDGCKEL